MTSNADEPFKVNVTLKHAKAIVSRVQLAAGHETEQHSHPHDYVVIPRAPTSVLKTTFKDGEQTGQEEIEHTPGQPYFVAASADGITFTLKNIGDAADAVRQDLHQAEVKGGELVGAEGFEPSDGGFKVRCLTAWRRPIRAPA